MTQTIEWLERLAAEPTVSTAPNLEFMQSLAHVLTRLGAVCRLFPDQRGTKASLLSRMGPDAPGGLLLSAHIDVVTVEGQSWSRPPFRLTRDNGRLYGRGTADLKGFVAAMLSLAEGTGAIDRPLQLAISHDEELGCIGVRPILDMMAKEGLRPSLVIVGEPTSLDLGLGHKGKVALAVTALGTPRHSADAPLALNALHIAADFITALRRLQDDIASSGPFAPGYSVAYTTVHVGLMSGETAVNLVPAEAQMQREIRPVAADPIPELIARLEALAVWTLAPWRLRFPEAGLTLHETNRYPGLDSRIDDHSFAAFSARFLPDAKEVRLAFGTEAGLFVDALKAPVVVCGPGDMAQGHCPDEFIAEEQAPPMRCAP